MRVSINTFSSHTKRCRKIDVLIQTMGVLFTASTLALALALQGNQLLTTKHGTLSVAALLPAIVGMVVGQRIRQSLSEQLCQRIFFVSLLALGSYIIINAFGAFN